MVKTEYYLNYNLCNHLTLFKFKTHMYIHIHILIKILLEIFNILLLYY